MAKMFCLIFQHGCFLIWRAVFPSLDCPLSRPQRSDFPIKAGSIRQTAERRQLSRLACQSCAAYLQAAYFHSSKAPASPALPLLCTLPDGFSKNLFQHLGKVRYWNCPQFPGIFSGIVCGDISGSDPGLFCRFQLFPHTSHWTDLSPQAHLSCKRRFSGHGNSPNRRIEADGDGKAGGRPINHHSTGHMDMQVILPDPGCLRRLPAWWRRFP